MYLLILREYELQSAPYQQEKYCNKLHIISQTFYSKSSNNTSSIHRKKEVLFLFKYYVNQYRVHIQTENIPKNILCEEKEKQLKHIQTVEQRHHKRDRKYTSQYQYITKYTRDEHVILATLEELPQMY